MNDHKFYVSFGMMRGKERVNVSVQFGGWMPRETVVEQCELLAGKRNSFYIMHDGWNYSSYKKVWERG